MYFLSFRNANVKFGKLSKLTWKIYTIAEALPATSQVQLFNKREFAKAALDKNSKNFIMHVITLEMPTAMIIHLFWTS